MLPPGLVQSMPQAKILLCDFRQTCSSHADSVNAGAGFNALRTRPAVRVKLASVAIRAVRI